MPKFVHFTRDILPTKKPLAAKNESILAKDDALAKGGERCVSYGRGGAGNLQRASQVKIAAEIVAGDSNKTSRRRGSSIWSFSTDSKRSTDSRSSSVLMRMFRRSTDGPSTVQE